MKNLILLLFVFIYQIGFSQEKCISHKILENQILNAPNQAALLEEINSFNSNNFIPTKSANIIKVPIVFHIFHNGDALGTNENLTDSIILEQLKRINTDFRAKNIDSTNIPAEFKSLFADAEIEFCLAKKDPNGNFTSGINRYERTNADWTESDIENIAKPQTIWNRDYYLNVWIFKFGGSLGTNLVNGYATPPFSSTADTIDGIVLNYLKVGNNIPNNIGRTAVHEIGHWFGLRHIWGDDAGACTGDDFIDDTPNQADSYYNCPSGTPNSCGSNDMFMNYMDYTDASCSLMFTKGQTVKMKSVLNGFRASLLSSQACKVADLVIEDIIFPSGTVCQERILAAAKIKNIGSDTIFSYGFSYFIDNILQDTKIILDTLVPNASAFVNANYSFTVSDNLTHEVRFEMATNTVNEYSLNNVKTANFNVVSTGAGFPAAFSQDFESASFPPDFMFIQNTNNDITWTSFNGTSNKVAWIDNTNNTAGNIDALITTDYNLADISDASYVLNFDYIYQKRANFSDTFSVYFSINCGVQWFPLWSKSGENLSILPESNSSFTYTDEAFETVSLNLCSETLRLCDFEKIRFKFENKSGGGSPIYLDNINISLKTGIREIEKPNISFFPNPNSGILNFKNSENLNAKVNIYGVSGALVNQIQLNKKSTSFDINHLSNGLYFIEIIEGENYKISREKLVVKH